MHCGKHVEPGPTAKPGSPTLDEHHVVFALNVSQHPHCFDIINTLQKYMAREGVSHDPLFPLLR